MGSGEAAGDGSGLSVRLLGGFGLEWNGEPLAVDSARLRSLLAYLVLRPGEDQPRERLAYLFWPDSDEGQARTNMRQALHRLRQVIPDADRFLSVERGSIAWRADAPAYVDVAEFEALARGGDPDALERSVEVYSGDLFPECYDDWIEPDRQRLRDEYAGVAARLADRLELAREYPRAISLARRVCESDPLNEDSVRRLMRLWALSGDRSAALGAYHSFATTLARETGVDPGPEIQAAYERLLEGDEPAEEEAGPLVGREDEWEALRGIWRRATRNEARLVAITGEAGIGKSRLADELRGWVARQGFAVASSRCYSAAGALAYAPVAEFLRSPAIARGVGGLGDPWLVEVARFAPELVEERPDLPQPQPLTDDVGRSRLLEGMSRAVLASDGPLLLILDDVQWCDEETIGWLSYLLRSNPSAPLLVLATGRSEDLAAAHPARELIREAGEAGHGDELELSPLDRADTNALALSVAGAVDDSHVEALFRETEGNPLFVVEWARAGLSGADAPDVPPRVQSVIEARISRLSSEAQELASLAATAGRAFDFDVLESASPRREEQVIDALEELCERRFVRELPGGGYDFTHDKLRDAAYERVSAARRRMFHRRVAQATESHATDLDAVATELAGHYEKAGWADRAAGFYARAAEAARRVYSNERAIALFERALALLEAEPPSPQRDRRELSLRTALGPPLVSIAGYGAPEVHAGYQRAWELCERTGVPPAPPVLRGLALVSIARGELQRARELGAELLERGVSEDDAPVRVEGRYVLGVTSFWLGDFESARRELERAVAEYDPAQARRHIADYSQDPRVVCLSRLALALHYLGEPEAAEERAREALRHAEELEHPFTLAYALNFTAWLAIETGDAAAARERAEWMAAIAEDEQLGFVRPMGTVLRGWLLAQDGRIDDAVAMIREGIDSYARSGWSLYQPYALTLLARICLAEGRTDEARSAIAEALEVSAGTGQRYLDPELRGLQARL
jgi:DNA-binding SARP family transcriptional activator/tetratricopeptide (TPR) repeat protein